jgi:hypothetical protein
MLNFSIVMLNVFKKIAIILYVVAPLSQPRGKILSRLCAIFEVSNNGFKALLL